MVYGNLLKLDLEKEFFNMGEVKDVLTARYVDFLEFWLADDEYELRLALPSDKAGRIKMFKERIEESKRKLDRVYRGN